MDMLRAAGPASVGKAGTDSLDEIADAVFHRSGVNGVYARTALFEAVADGLSALISNEREPDTEVLSFPPVMSRGQLEASGYLNSFPNLLGCVCALHGSEVEIAAAAQRLAAGGDWTTALTPTDLVLAPAACYPVYPLAASRGPVPPDGLRFDVKCDCFRHEPSQHLARLQAFRMREYVRVGSPETIAEFRDCWITRAQRMADALGLIYRVAPASDPFFGRNGQMMAVSQLQQSLKFELVAAMRAPEPPTACMSFNTHLDHFAAIWGLRDEAGEAVHTGCVAFGIDRLALALFCTHGLDLGRWPLPVRRALSL
jgi:seryl-tRNA synthetase